MRNRERWIAAASLAACAALTPGPRAAAMQESPRTEPRQEKKQEKPKEVKEGDAKAAEDEEKVKPARIGETAPAFELADLAGEKHRLDALAGKVVVLTWWDPDCPVVKMHEEAGTLATLVAKYREKEVVFLPLHSSPPPTNEVDRTATLRAALAERHLPELLLLDPAGKVARAYGAKRTTEVCIVDAQGRLAYRGAVDDGDATKPGRTNYVDLALTSLLAKLPVALTETPPYGTPLKF